MSAGAGQGWFVAGALVLMVAGGAHALLTLVDTVRPTWFAPIDASATRVMEGTGMRFRALFPGDAARPSMWRVWLGFNVSHGVGVCVFGLLCLLIATDDYALVGQIHGLRLLSIAFPAVYILIALRYWFWTIVLLTGGATACFTIAAVLAG